jgi:hypothetical protein
MPAPLVIPAAIWGYRAYRAYRALQAVAQATQAARAAQAIRAAQIAMAAKRAEELSKAGERDKVCEDCPNPIPCFNSNGNDAEFARQLKEQQDAIKNMSPDEILERIEKYKELKRKAVVGDAAARALARAEYERRSVTLLTRKYRLQKIPGPEARRRAIEETAKEMKNLDATHNLDLRAGGDGTVSGVADRGVNRSIGRQWSDKRADALEKEAKDAKARGQEKMNVKLEIC